MKYEIGTKFSFKMFTSFTQVYLKGSQRRAHETVVELANTGLSSLYKKKRVLYH